MLRATLIFSFLASVGVVRATGEHNVTDFPSLHMSTILDDMTSLGDLTSNSFMATTPNSTWNEESILTVTQTRPSEEISTMTLEPMTSLPPTETPFSPPSPRGEWYVTKPDGRHVNDSMCRSRDNPCDNLSLVVLRSEIHDIIFIDNGGDDEYIFNICGETKAHRLEYYIEKPLFIQGYQSKPRIKCARVPDVTSREEGTFVDNTTESELPRYAVVRHMALPNETCYVKITDIIFLDTVLSFSNCTVEMHNVSLFNSSVVSWGNCHHLDMTIVKSEWYGSQKCNPDGACTNNFLNNLTCHFTRLTMHENLLYQTTFIVDQPMIISGVAQVTVTDCVFSNADTELQFLGGLHLTFWSNNSNIFISNCLFSRLIHPTRVQSVINLYDAAIWVKATSAPPGHRYLMPTNPAIVEIVDCTFYDNERGVTAVGVYQTLIIARSHFEKNMAMHAGAGILVLIDPNEEWNILQVLNCTFISNFAGSYRQHYPIYEKKGAFAIVGEEVFLNAECCKGVVMMVGKGGAIRAQRGKVYFNNCRFENNRAKLLGGSLMVDIDGTVNISHTSFSVDENHEHALQGDIVYSDGNVTISHVTILIGRSMNGLSVVRHSGDHWSLDVTNIYIKCPVGYNLRTTNSSAYGVHDHGLRRSFFLDQLSYFCESCPRNKYSLDHGYLNYTIVFDQFSYFTLLINGSEPVPQYTGKYIHHEIGCDDCPYGGHCVHGITSVANFWGFNKQNSSVKFQHCPKGYCCSTPKKCPSIDSCVEKRYGRLCGRCIKGYSEALFSSSCVPNDRCGPFWLWPLGLSIGLFYYLFLLFQTDMKNFLFSEPLQCCKPRSKKKKVPTATLR